MQTITLNNSVQRMKVGQKGNSIYISIPKSIMISLGIHKGDTLLVGQADGVGFFKKEEELTLKSLLASVPEDYQPRKGEGWSEEEILEAWN